MRQSAILIALLTAVSPLAWAAPTSSCNQPGYLSQGFDLASYQQCTTALQQCPKNGPYTDLSCAANVVKTHTDCNQLAALATSLQADTTQLSAGPIGTDITTITVQFPADGKQHFYLISHDNCLIDSVVDPRPLNPLLMQPYAGLSLLFANDSPLELMHETDGTQSIKSHLVFTQDCAACQPVGTAVVKFNFTAQGDYKSTRLHNVDKIN